MTMNLADQSPHDNIAWHIWVGVTVTLVFAFFGVVARLISRRISAAKFWWDDWTICLALIINIAMAATRYSEIIYFDYGRHAQFVSPEKVVNFWKSFLAVQMTYFSDAVVTKTSILLLYLRVFGVVRGFRIALLVAAAIIWSYWIGCMIASVAGCSPVSYFWYKKQPGHCIDEVNFFRWNGITNLFLDVAVLCLPLPMVWRLKTSVRQRVILSLIFLVGGFVCVTSIFRIIAFNRSNPKDPTYTTIDTAMWSSIEQSTGIFCACLPTLRPLFGRLYNGGTTTKGSNTGAGSYGPRSRQDGLQLSELGNQPSNWRPSAETSSTVGFARTTDGYSPQSDDFSGVKGGLGGGVHTGVAAGRRDDTLFDIPSRILLKQEIHQQTEQV